MLKGWPAQEVWTSLHPALDLAKSLERHDALAPILWGLTNNIYTQGRVAGSLLWVQETLNRRTMDVASLCSRCIVVTPSLLGL